MEKLKALTGEHQLASYEEACQSFEWTQAEALFSWNLTGKVNLAYEAIDRHAESELATKVALLYFDGDREERYTYADMKQESNRSGNVLKSIGVEKGDRVFIFMPRQPELYFILLGAIKQIGRASWGGKM